MTPSPIEQAARVFYEARRKATGLDIHGAVEVRWDDLPEQMKSDYRAGMSALHEAGMLVGGEPVAWRWTDQGIRFMAYPWEERPDYAEALYALPTPEEK